MDVSDLIVGLRREGDLLASAAANTNLDSLVPTCPEWRVRDLVRHIGGVHRWAAAHVRDPRLQPLSGIRAVVPEWPADAQLVEWFREGHAELVAVLAAADPALECWTFLEAPSPVAFWARRQAHETGIHRVDAEGASGAITPFPAGFVVDGIEEVLYCFAARPGGKLRNSSERTLRLRAEDAGREWLVRIGPDKVEVVRSGLDDADCTVRATASDLHLLVWNRRTSDGLEVEADAALLDLWRDSVRMRWTGD
jgi:uncharacterized protein (TIGR03083 family)